MPQTLGISRQIQVCYIPLHHAILPHSLLAQNPDYTSSLGQSIHPPLPDSPGRGVGRSVAGSHDMCPHATSSLVEIHHPEGGLKR